MNVFFYSVLLSVVWFEMLIITRQCNVHTIQFTVVREFKMGIFFIKENISSSYVNLIRNPEV